MNQLAGLRDYHRDYLCGAITLEELLPAAEAEIERAIAAGVIVDEPTAEVMRDEARTLATAERSLLRRLYRRHERGLLSFWDLFELSEALGAEDEVINEHAALLAGKRKLREFCEQYLADGVSLERTLGIARERVAQYQHLNLKNPPVSRDQMPNTGTLGS